MKSGLLRTPPDLSGLLRCDIIMMPNEWNGRQVYALPVTVCGTSLFGGEAETLPRF